MSIAKVYVGEVRMLPEELTYLNDLFKQLSGSFEEVGQIISRHLDKGEVRPTRLTFTLSYDAPLLPGELVSEEEKQTHNSIRVRVSYPDGTHGSLEDPPGVSYAS
jgi:hypothetical protein